MEKKNEKIAKFAVRKSRGNSLGGEQYNLSFPKNFIERLEINREEREVLIVFDEKNERIMIKKIKKEKLWK